MSRELLVDRVYRHLLGQLALRRFPVGSHLNAQKIAAELEVSRTSVTGAIVRLVDDGWVGRVRGRRPVVLNYPERENGSAGGDFEFVNQTEQTYEAILERIQRGDFRPGELLKERRLAHELGVNPVTVHRAAEWLRNDGLLERLRRRGWQVVQLRLDDLKDIYRIRLLLEPRALRLAAPHLTEAVLDDLESQTDRIIGLGERASTFDRRKVDHNFHVSLMQHCGSRILRETLEPLIHRSILFTTVGFRYSRVVISFGEHKKVLQALRKGDAAAAARHLKEHLRRALVINTRMWGRADDNSQPRAKLTKIEQNH